MSQVTDPSSLLTQLVGTTLLASKVVPTNCVKSDDGSVTCDTKVENPPGTTPARPSYEPFSN